MAFRMRLHEVDVSPQGDEAEAQGTVDEQRGHQEQPVEAVAIVHEEQESDQQRRLDDRHGDDGPRDVAATAVDPLEARRPGRCPGRAN